MKKLHIIQNDPEVPPGNIIESLSVPFVLHHPYRDAFLPEPDQIAALIVLGGAMGADDDTSFPFLSALKNLIRTIVLVRIPYLGICLGGQLLASALGASVVSGRWEELGTMNVSLTQKGKADTLFGGLAEEFTTFQWHHDSFDIPHGGILLAASATCPHQAFRVGGCAWGTQFHPEVTEKTIRNWCSWDLSTAALTEELVSAYSAGAERYRKTSQQLMKNFMTAALLLS